MRTRSVVCLLLVAATAVWGGQPSGASFQYGDLATLRSSRQHHRIAVKDPRFQQWLDRHLDASASARRLAEPVGAPPRPPLVVHANFLSPASDPIVLAKEQAMRQAPFDTVLEEGFYGPRRYIFEQVGPTTMQRTQSTFSNGWDITESIVSTYTPAGLPAFRTVLNPSYVGGVASRESRTYDPPSCQTSCRWEYFDKYTGALSYMAFDSACYGETGSLVMAQWEAWIGGELKFGEKDEYASTDTSWSMTTYGTSEGGWMPYERSITTWHSWTNHIDELIDRWRGGRWVNYRHIQYMCSSEHSGEVARSWVWLDRDWTPESRTIISMDTRGTWSEQLTMRWEGGAWLARERWRAGFDVGLQTQYNRYDLFDSVWVPQHSTATFNNEEGFREQVDTSWSGGSSWRRDEVTTDASGNIMKQMSEDWADGAIASRSCLAESYTPSGRVAEYRSTTWEASWQTDERYAFTYDANDRITALRHFYQADTGWVLSCLPSPDAGYGYSTSWDLDLNTPACYTDWSFNGFTELTFRYRMKVTGVGHDTPALPQTTTLFQNYPNPFNPTTTIPFTVATGARTTLAIYDVLGREVARPVDAWKDPGEYRAEFDAKGLASGMYICRFTSGTVTQTQKLMLVR